MVCQVLAFFNAADCGAVQPANDSFTNAIELTNYWVTVAGNNEYATREPGDPTAGDKSVWWSWTAPTSGVYTITAVGLPGYFSPFLGVYSGTTLAGLTLLAGNSHYDEYAYTARVTINVASGVTYRIAVTTVGGMGGDFSLSLVPTVPPTVTITHPTNNATFCVGDTVVLTADASDSDGTITNLELYLDFESVQRSTNNSCQLTLNFTNGPEGHRLWARATDNSGVTSISATINFTATYPPPVNDNFTDAISLTDYWVTVAGNNEYATREPGDPTAGDKSVWWSWTAPASGVYTITAVGLPGYFQPFLGVYTGTALSGLTSMASNYYYDDYTARVTINVASGVTYHIAVTTVGGMGGDFSLSLVPTTPPTVSITHPTNNATVYVGDTVILRADASDNDGIITNTTLYLDFEPVQTSTNGLCQLIFPLTNGPMIRRLWARTTDNSGVTSVSSDIDFTETYPPPINDNFANAIALTDCWVTVTGNNEYATREPGDPTSGDKSVWWSWTAPTSGVYTVTAVGWPGGFQPFLGVYAGTVLSDLTLVASDYDYDDYTARVPFNVVSGVTYHIAVTTVGGMGGDFSLSLVPTVPPTVTITHPAGNATLYIGDIVALAAEASDSDGTVTNLMLYLDFQPVKRSTNNSCELGMTFTGGPITHRLRARATDNSGVTSVSDEIEFTVTYRPPVNDNFADAIALTNYWVTVTGNNAYATREPGDPTAGDKSVWWSWTAPTSGVYTVTAAGMGYYYPFQGIYSGTTITNLTLIGSDTYDGSSGMTYAARVEVSPMEGATYVIAVSTVAGFGGDIALCIVPAALPGAPATLNRISSLADGSCRLHFITGITNNWVIEASTNLVNWVPVSIAFPPGCSLAFTDYDAAASPLRFYRLRAAP